jgi:hypothetical protein
MSMRHFVTVVFLALFSAWALQPTPSQPPQQGVAWQPDRKSEETKQHSDTQQGIAQNETSFATKATEGEQAQGKANDNASKTPKEAPESKGWSLSDKIAAVASIIAAVQSFALFWTIREMRMSSQRELRAYLSAEECKLADGSQIREAILSSNKYRQNLVSDDVQDNKPYIHIAIKNSGQTPAYRVGHFYCVYVTDNENEIMEPSIPPHAERPYVGPGSGMVRRQPYERILSDSEIDEIRAAIKAIYVVGRIEYIDAFGCRHFTNYRLKYSGAYPPIGTTFFAFCERGNNTDDY